MTDETPTGTTNARLSRLELKYDDLSTRMDGAVRTIERVEDNQRHAEELNKLRFASLDTAVGSLASDLKGFMTRIDGIISGEVQTQQTRQGAELVAEYQRWRSSVEQRLDAQDVLNGQVRLLGRLAVILVSSNLLAIGAAIYALVN